MEDKQKLRECNINNHKVDMSLSDQCCSDDIKLEDDTLKYEVTDNTMEDVKVEIKSEMEEYNVIYDEKPCINGKKSSLLSHLSIERFLKKEQEIEIIETVSDSSCKEEHVNEHPKEKTINNAIHFFRHFKCEICSQEFFSARQLRRHLRTHVAEKTFKCHICSKEFSQADHFNIKQHITTHTEKKSFKCEICSLGFSSAFQVGRHVKTHTAEQPFKCYICSKEFSQSDYFNIEKHMTTHTEKKSFKCEICSQEFSSTVQVERHVRTHTEEKPLKGYITIKKHMTTHTEKNSFKCEICSQWFSSSVQVGRHDFSRKSKE
uniref:Zinc finger protein 287-like isoform X4 n=1 Tax=Diabrotica virgifera virgifera TaxID=50390 RepID=A0A6P7G448_DIAVI